MATHIRSIGSIRSALSRILAEILAAAAGGMIAVSARAQAPGGFEEILKAAKAEGSLTFYTIAPENMVRPFIALFSEKYGIRADFVRLSSAALGQRHAAELAAGNPAADLAFLNNADTFLQEGLKKGWFEPVQEAGLPVLRSGEFPARFQRPGSAIVQISPYHILFNTEKLKGAEVPKGWQDLLNPRYKGQILISDPAESDSLLDVWALLQDTYGEAFFAGLRAQQPRWMSGTIAAAQALGAGEGALQVPATHAVARTVSEKGAPVSAVLPDPTTGTETYLLMTHRSKAKHPNAARVFANYFLSPEGNKAFAKVSGAGTFSVYDTAGLPRHYSSPKSGTVARNAELRKLLGLAPRT